MYERPLWNLSPTRDDEFALALSNPDKVDINGLRRLFRLMLESTGRVPFSEEARDAWEKWFEQPAAPIPSQAYARISNWAHANPRDSVAPRGIVAWGFWNSLFFTIPEHRLTGTEKNGEVLPEYLLPWWDNESQHRRTF